MQGAWTHGRRPIKASVWCCQGLITPPKQGDVFQILIYADLAADKIEHVSKVKAFGGDNGQFRFELHETFQSIAPRLPVRHARLLLKLSIPIEADSSQVISSTSKQSSSGCGKLGKLRISTRYADVDRNVMGYGMSTTKQSKIDSGEYQDTYGQFSQRGYIKAMQAQPPEGSDSDADVDTSSLTLRSQELLVYDKGKEQIIFRAKLKGPVLAMANWDATCAKFRRGNGQLPLQDRKTPFPVFIPSRGRAWRGHINYEAEHAFGPTEDPPTVVKTGIFEDDVKVVSKIMPVVCIVVEPRDEDEYRKAWPSSLMLILPENDRGPGYARWVIQRVCTKASAKQADGKWREIKFPWVWVCDDGLSMFYKLEALRVARGSRIGRAEVYSTVVRGG